MSVEGKRERRERNSLFQPRERDDWGHVRILFLALRSIQVDVPVPVEEEIHELQCDKGASVRRGPESGGEGKRKRK